MHLHWPPDWVPGLMPEGISVAWENVPFTPPANEMYLAVHDLPVTPRTINLGLRCRTYSGVYQINVVAPAGSGRTSVVALASRVAELFPEGQKSPAKTLPAGLAARLAYSAASLPVSYTVPVSLNYRADITS
ncbi:phage tail terminator-like protein [Enterobacter hormaechei]